jgi:hypothetical protein
MNFFDYRSRSDRRRRRKRAKKEPDLTKAEKYIVKIKAGCGSRRFRDWLSSKPMDRFVVRSNKLK